MSVRSAAQCRCVPVNFNVRPMLSLHISLNGRELAQCGTEACCTLNWQIIASRMDPDGGTLTVSGMVDREDGKYDHFYWFEDHSLKDGDVLAFNLVEGSGGSPVLRIHTHEQLEELRIEVNRAEAAGEFEAERAAARARREQPLRPSCEIDLRLPGRSRRARATDSVIDVMCDGMWSRDHRSGEWRLRLWRMPLAESEGGFWHSIEGGAVVALTV